MAEKVCPGHELPCREDCAMFIQGYGCRFTILPKGYKPEPTEGKYCPLFYGRSDPCGEWCAFFKDGGCTQCASKIVQRRKAKTLEDVLLERRKDI